MDDYDDDVYVIPKHHHNDDVGHFRDRSRRGLLTTPPHNIQLSQCEELLYFTCYLLYSEYFLTGIPSQN